MNRKIQTLVVEDEPLEREGLINYIKDIDFLEVKAACENALEANQVLTSTKGFLKIDEPLSGTEFLTLPFKKR